jgi:hypothetical protein
MPTFYFDIIHDEASYTDEVGSELPDHVAAWEEATQSAGQTLRDIDGRLKPGSDWTMLVKDRDRRTVYCITVHTTQKLL